MSELLAALGALADYQTSDAGRAVRVPARQRRVARPLHFHAERALDQRLVDAPQSLHLTTKARQTLQQLPALQPSPPAGLLPQLPAPQRPSHLQALPLPQQRPAAAHFHPA